MDFDCILLPMMKPYSSQKDVLAITFAPVPSWMLMIFGTIFFLLGLVFLMPFLPKQRHGPKMNK